MIFSLTLDKLLNGFKTQTRRLKKPHESLVYINDIWRVESKTAKRHIIAYQVGRTYSVQPERGQKAVAYIILRGIREEAVQDISQDDAHAEGFESREEFFATWRAIHGVKADLQQRVWVLEFELLSIYNKRAEDDPQIAEKRRQGVSRRSLLDLPARSSNFTIPSEEIGASLHIKRDETQSIMSPLSPRIISELYGKHVDAKEADSKGFGPKGEESTKKDD